jgi:hypothetical protein
MSADDPELQRQPQHDLTALSLCDPDQYNALDCRIRLRRGSSDNGYSFVCELPAEHAGVP